MCSSAAASDDGSCCSSTVSAASTRQLSARPSTVATRPRVRADLTRSRTRHRGRVRPPIESLVVGAPVTGVVTGVLAYGAFIDVGVGVGGRRQDGMLHVSRTPRSAAAGHAVDLRQHLFAGDRISSGLWVDSVDARAGCVSLTGRQPSAEDADGGERPASPAGSFGVAVCAQATLSAPGASAAAAAAAATPGTPVTPSDAPSSLAVLRGHEPAPQLRPPPPPVILVRREVDGVVRVLYKMPWRHEPASSP